MCCNQEVSADVIGGMVSGEAMPPMTCAAFTLLTRHSSGTHHVLVSSVAALHMAVICRHLQGSLMSP